MSQRIEWRSRVEFDGDRLNDALLEIEEGTEQVVRAWSVRPELLTDFLNDMDNLDDDSDDHLDVAQLKPTNWGDLVLARSRAGDVLSIDPQLYWEGVAGWFRSQGTDPHLWSRTH